MALYEVKTKNTTPGAKAAFAVEVPDEVAREYVTVANSAIAAVLAKVSALLIKAENPDGFLHDGQALAKRIAD